MKENEESNEANTSRKNVLKNNRKLFSIILIGVVILSFLFFLMFTISGQQLLNSVKSNESQDLNESVDSQNISDEDSNNDVDNSFNADLCGDGVCYEGLTADNCPSDCHPECGTGIVEEGDGKTWTNCRTDLRSNCGDGVCQDWEHYVYCSEDCAECIDDRAGNLDPDEMYPVGPDSKLVPVCPRSERLS